MKLSNRTNRTITLNLAHDVVCSEDECLCSSITHRAVELDARTGETGIRETDRLVCSSVHILPRETVELPDSAKGLSEVRAALALRSLMAA